MDSMIFLSCRQYLPGTVDDLQPGFTLSECVVCEKQVQVSPRCVAIVAAGNKPFCNVCAVKFLDNHKDQIDVLMTPEAHEQLGRLIAKMKKESAS